ncbi:class I SAM-dependent methyltransferase [Alteromonas sediminis]|uniref:Class I SAM-dependent methyltransferase n=1 Tax=Alteromonas sediminis TaxID=2259342 RepID=A0A3N5XXQ1_9ALTE|nr:methyltransferase [Alteromonas sediminis]RPJ65817.1 class I SAM-dependent methyltransferase [Alteromonas sediminis]
MTIRTVSLDEAIAMCKSEVPFAIYGFAATGKLLYSQTKEAGNTDHLVAVYDIKADEINKDSPVFPVSSPKDADKGMFERIFITNFSASQSIATYLSEEKGINTNRIFLVKQNELVGDFSHAHNDEWINGAKEEVHYWTTKIGCRDIFEPSMNTRANPATEFKPELLSLFKNPKHLDVLDVGSGVVSVLGYVAKGTKINLEMVDPLADFYHQLYEKFNFHPPVKPKRGAGEELLDLYPSASFDLVYCCNALDHAEDPLLILKNMSALIRNNGVIHINVQINEGEHNKYSGLHQWNFEIREGQLYLWRPGQDINLENALRPFGQLTIVSVDNKKRQIEFQLHKKATF